MPDPRPRVLAWGVLPPPLHGQSVMNEVTKTLLSRDHDVTWCNPTASTSIEELEQISVRKVLIGLATMARFAFAALRWRPDLAYISPARSGAALARDTLAWAVAVRTARRVVVHLHTGELGFLRSADPLGRVQRRLLRSSEAWAQTEDWAEQMSALGTRRAEVVPNGVTCGADHADWVREVPSAGPLHVVYIGNLAYDKGIDVFAEAVAGLLDTGAVRVTVAGAAFEAGTEKLIEPLVATHPDRVARIHGFDEVGRCSLLRSADVLVFPSRYEEAFSLVVCEAMEHGVVPVVSRRGALPVLVGSAGCCADGPGEVAEELQRLHDDRPLLRRQSAASSARWREHYSRERYFDTVEKALRA